MKKLMYAFGLVVLLTTASSALATPINFDVVGADDTTLRAHVTANYVASTSTLSFLIKNTTQTVGKITGFAFNLPSDGLGITKVSLASGNPAGWSVLATAKKNSTSFSPNNVSTPQQFGMFDVGVITGPNMDSGKPSRGIDVNQQQTFNLIFSGSGASGLSTASIIAALSQVGHNNDVPTSFLVRFQATTDGGSDVARPANTPVPAALWLLGSGLAGLVGLRRKFAA